MQALVVEVPGAEPGAVVRFETGPGTEARMFVARIAEADFGSVATEPLRSNRRAAVRVKLGTKAGSASVRITVPEIGAEILASYTIRPAAPVRVVIAPGDTAVTVGRSATLRVAVADQFGNPRTDPVTLASLDPTVSTTGTSVTGVKAGRGRVEARFQELRDTSDVMVVPDAVLSAVRSDGIVVFRSDGAVISTVSHPTPTFGGTADWSPGGDRLAFSITGELQLMEGDEIHRRGPAGSIFYPRFSPDGQWLYYSWFGPFGFEIRRMRPDGGDDALVLRAPGSVASAPSPTGDRIAYTQSGPDELFVVNLATMTELSLGHGHTPAWRPGSEEIAAVSGGQIILVAPNGASRRQLGSTAGFALGIDWSADGKWLVGQSQGQITLVEAATGLILPLPYSVGWAAPAWRD